MPDTSWIEFIKTLVSTLTGSLIALITTQYFFYLNRKKEIPRLIVEYVYNPYETYPQTSSSFSIRNKGLSFAKTVHCKYKEETKILFEIAPNELTESFLHLSEYEEVVVTLDYIDDYEVSYTSSWSLRGPHNFNALDPDTGTTSPTCIPYHIERV